MAEFYLDISAVGNEYQAYADTPTTWAVPQDGNGKAGPGHTAAVAISTIDVAGCTGTTASVGVMGVSLTGLSATGAALATAIAAAINASATAVSATYSALLLPLNKLVYARVNPGLSTQVQIMLRIAGTDWVGFTPTQASISPAATISNFAGGADGPFAYVTASASLFGRSAAAGYGIWFNAPASVTQVTGSDIVHCRTRRSGVNLSASYSYTAAYSVTWQARTYLYDDGRVWSGDDGTLSIEIVNASVAVATMTHAYSYIHHEARKKYGFELLAKVSGHAGAFLQLMVPNSNGTSAIIRRCKLTESAGSIGIYTFWSEITNRGGSALHLRDSLLTITGGRQPITSTGATSFQHEIVLDGTDVALINVVGTCGPILNFVSTSANCGLIRWIGGSIYDVNGVYQCPSPIYVGTGGTVAANVILKDVKGITDPSLALLVGRAGSQLLWDDKDGFRLETNNYVVDWKSVGFPYLNSQNLYGDYWSHRITWKNASLTGPLVFDAQFRAASAVKTVVLELYAQDATPLYLDEFTLAITYTDSSNVQRTEVSAEAINDSYLTRTALTDSLAVWSPNGVSGYSPKRLSVTTQYPIKSNSRVTGRLTLNPGRAPTLTIHVSPELVFE